MTSLSSLEPAQEDSIAEKAASSTPMNSQRSNVEAKMSLWILTVLALVGSGFFFPVHGQPLASEDETGRLLASEDLRLALRLLSPERKSLPSPYPETARFTLEEPSELKLAATGLIRAYQKFVSTQDLPVCNFTPSCSRFGMSVIQRAGVARGLLLTADRLIRDNGCLLDRFYVRDPRTGRFSDPVERYVGAPRRDGRRTRLVSQMTTPVSPSYAVDYDAPENVLRFADHLYEEGDYLRAAGEYQRYLLQRQDAPLSVRLRVARGYYLGGRPQQALRFLERQLHVAETEHDRAELRYAMAEIEFLTGNYEASLALLKAPAAGEDAYPTQTLIGLNYLKLKRWSAAHALFAQLAEDANGSEWSERAKRYEQYALEGMHLPRKSPWLAGLLSALFPGAGRLYLGRVNDALMTLFVLGITGWQAYDGFSEEGSSSAKGWFYGILAGTFYLGNVYGSVIGAKLENRDAEAALLLSIPLPE